MRIAGPLALDLVLLAVGTATLFGLGLVRSPRQALRCAGLAFVVGWCLLGALISCALVLGSSLAVWVPLALAGALVVAALTLGRVVPAASDHTEQSEHGLPRIVAVGATACLVAYVALLGLHAAITTSPAGWDAWAFWLPHAKVIYFFHGLQEPHLRGGFGSFAHPEYPPLVPAFDATVFKFAGGAAVLALPFQDWLLAAAFVGAAAVVLGRRVRGAVLWPALCLVVLTPQFGAGIGDGHADPQLARLVALAGVCGGVWVLERDGRLLALTGILLVAAVLTKREGLALGILLAAALALAARVEGGSGWWRALMLGPALVCAALPWQIWLHVEHMEYTPDYSLRAVSHPVLLVHRIGRLRIALEHLPRVVLSFDHWILAVPLALFLALLALRARSGPAVLVLTFVLLGYIGLACVYWIGTLPVAWYMRTSASRVDASLVVLAGALTPLLAAELLRPEPSRGQGRVRDPGTRRAADLPVGREPPTRSRAGPAGRP